MKNLEEAKLRHSKHTDVFVSIKSTCCTSGQRSHDAVGFMTQLFMKLEDIILPWQGQPDIELFRCRWEDWTGPSEPGITQWGWGWGWAVGGGRWVVGLRVHLQLTHAEPSSLGSVGGRGGLVERTSVHLLEREARRPFKMGNYEEACDYL